MSDPFDDLNRVLNAADPSRESMNLLIEKLDIVSESLPEEAGFFAGMIMSLFSQMGHTGKAAMLMAWQTERFGNKPEVH